MNDPLSQLVEWWDLAPRWVFELLFVVYAVLITGFVVLERRRPTATMAWVLSLIFVPLLGLAAYVVLGRRRVRRRRRERRRRPVSALEGTRLMANVDHIPEDLPEPARGLVRLAVKTAAAPVRRAQQVELLSTPMETFSAVQVAIEQATRHIHLEFYIWRDDETGRMLTNMLTEKARAGVKVRVLYDHVGSLGIRSSHFAALREAGGMVAAFGPVRVPIHLFKGRLNYRNHRKLIAIDGSIGFVGGLNIGTEYLGSDDRQRWRDLQLSITGDALLGLEAIFIEDWLVSTGEVLDLSGELASGTEGTDARLPARRHALRMPRALRRRRLAREKNPFSPPRDTPVTSKGPLLQIIPSGPDTEVASAIAAQFAAAISGARQRAWIATPYFIPDESLGLILRTTALRGVDVRILVPKPHHSDQRLVALASRSYYDELMDAGCRIFEYRLGMLHAKYLIVDDGVSAIGSANMDIRSFHINYEVTAMIYDARVTAALAEIFVRDLAGADEIRGEDRATLHLPARLGEGLARVLSPLM